MAEITDENDEKVKLQKYLMFMTLTQGDPLQEALSLPQSLRNYVNNTAGFTSKVICCMNVAQILVCIDINYKLCGVPRKTLALLGDLLA